MWLIYYVILVFIMRYVIFPSKDMRDYEVKRFYAYRLLYQP